MVFLEIYERFSYYSTEWAIKYQVTFNLQAVRGKFTLYKVYKVSRRIVKLLRGAYGVRPIAIADEYFSTSITIESAGLV